MHVSRNGVLFDDRCESFLSVRHIDENANLPGTLPHLLLRQLDSTRDLYRPRVRLLEQLLREVKTGAGNPRWGPLVHLHLYQAELGNVAGEEEALLGALGQGMVAFEETISCGERDFKAERFQDLVLLL